MAEPVSPTRQYLFGGGPPPVTVEARPGTDARDQVPAAGPATGLGAAPADPFAGLPPGTAQLIVLPGLGGQMFRLIGNCCCGDLEPHYKRRNEEPEHVRPDPLPLGRRVSRDARAGGERPTRTLKRMVGWSQQKAALTEWLSRLRRQHPRQLTLVIWDYTDHDLPWEMFFLGRQRAGPQGPALAADWLGCAATVVRWTKVVTTADNAVPGPVEPVACAGTVLAYVAADEAMQPDKALMESLGAVRRETLADLITSLDDSGESDGVGLIYVACHGDYADDYFGFRLDGTISVGDLDGRGLPGLAGARPLVFLNACHSARMVDASADLGENALAGFTEIFLRAGAGGFLGASGAVQEPAAQAVVRDLLGRIRATPDRPVARILQEYRQSVAPKGGELPLGDDDATAAALLPFFYGFMYLFFGSPLTTLRLDGEARP
ncbi:CHAT domain-containing protein [Paractinoplanes rishiriensis]|uniref:CHAT domain-containing protein n=1 Tax=Paractinoplanes rishiriensis TaxID=1050105 RepID=A0A919K4R2_9ACTN|nr:CHAT domain-containing protein [Actinoplanes rishiriensis]GIE98935.1 hypothetical protein Ari01nite_64000 [Actinoplanes rishiriensis]